MPGCDRLSARSLQRSGVGSAELLAEFDIPLVHDLPGVGENLQDHWRCTCNMSAKNRFPSTPALQWWNQPKIGAEWLFGGTGVGASNHFEAGGFIRSREGICVAEYSVPFPASGD